MKNFFGLEKLLASHPRFCFPVVLLALWGHPSRGCTSVQIPAGSVSRDDGFATGMEGASVLQQMTDIDIR